MNIRTCQTKKLILIPAIGYNLESGNPESGSRIKCGMTKEDYLSFLPETIATITVNIAKTPIKNQSK